MQITGIKRKNKQTINIKHHRFCFFKPNGKNVTTWDRGHGVVAGILH